ncbi:MAG: hypothetical protein ACPLXM_02720 [Bacteroidales bacterium]
MWLRNIPVKTGSFLGLLLALAMMTGCRSEGSKNAGNEQNTVDLTAGDEIFEDLNEAKKVFYSLPSPLETAVLLKSAGAKYNESLLNPLSNANNYTTNKQMALNLGIFSTDLSFASLFDQTQTSINYMQAAKKMADGLGILDAIDQTTIDRLEENVNNRDELMNIISETLMSSNSFLLENERKAVASIVLVGGWVEGLYIATQLVGNSPVKGNKLVERIVEQKFSLEIVLRLLEENKENPDVESILEQMNDLKKTFDKITIKTSAITPVEDPKTNVTLLKSKSEIQITQEIFNELREKAKSIRTNFTL